MLPELGVELLDDPLRVRLELAARAIGDVDHGDRVLLVQRNEEARELFVEQFGFLSLVPGHLVVADGLLRAAHGELPHLAAVAIDVHDQVLRVELGELFLDLLAAGLVGGFGGLHHGHEEVLLLGHQFGLHDVALGHLQRALAAAAVPAQFYEDALDVAGFEALLQILFGNAHSLGGSMLSDGLVLSDISVRSV